MMGAREAAHTRARTTELHVPLEARVVKAMVHVKVERQPVVGHDGVLALREKEKEKTNEKRKN